MHVPAALLVERYGGKAMLILAQFGTAVTLLAIPYAVAWADSTALIVLRLVMGVCQGGLMPSIATVISTWVPTNERGFLGSIAFVGFPIGTVFGKMVSGILLHHFHNWHYSFYYFGGIGVVGTVIYVSV